MTDSRNDGQRGQLLLIIAVSLGTLVPFLGGFFGLIALSRKYPKIRMYLELVLPSACLPSDGLRTLAEDGSEGVKRGNLFWHKNQRVRSKFSMWRKSAPKPSSRTLIFAGPDSNAAFPSTEQNPDVHANTSDETSDSEYDPAQGVFVRKTNSAAFALSQAGTRSHGLKWALSNGVRKWRANEPNRSPLPFWTATAQLTSLAEAGLSPDLHVDSRPEGVGNTEARKNSTNDRSAEMEVQVGSQTKPLSFASDTSQEPLTLRTKSQRDALDQIPLEPESSATAMRQLRHVLFLEAQRRSSHNIHAAAGASEQVLLRLPFRAGGTSKPQYGSIPIPGAALSPQTTPTLSVFSHSSSTHNFERKRSSKGRKNSDSSRVEVPDSTNRLESDPESGTSGKEGRQMAPNPATLVPSHLFARHSLSKSAAPFEISRGTPTPLKELLGSQQSHKKDRQDDPGPASPRAHPSFREVLCKQSLRESGRELSTHYSGAGSQP